MKKQQTVETVIGFRAIMEAIDAGKTIQKVFFKSRLQGELFQECFSLVRKNDIPFQYVPIEKLDQITRANHQGAIALISPIPYYNLEQIVPGLFEEGKDPFLLVLDGITDVRNFGAITRTAESAGVDAIIIGQKKAAIINTDAIKTSSGALHRIPICRVENIERALEYLHDSGIKIFGASEKAVKRYFDTDFTGPVAIVMGSEDTGLEDSVIKGTDELICIPMIGKTASLNVGVACGILLFEAVKQRIH
jgi:23S rRNA (guanosine2251-2'-O)-methyltransferase